MKPLSSYQGYVSHTAETETKVTTVTPILAAACHPVTYSFVINDEIGQTLYRKDKILMHPTELAHLLPGVDVPETAVIIAAKLGVD